MLPPAPAADSAAPPPMPPAAGPAVEPTPAEVEALRAKAAAAGFPSQKISEQQFQEMEQQSVSELSWQQR